MVSFLRISGGGGRDGSGVSWIFKGGEMQARKKSQSSASHRMKSSRARARDKRSAPRIPIQLKVDIESTQDHYLFEYSSNLSQSGIFIQTEEPLEPGTLVNIQFSLPDQILIRTRGEVMWKSDDEEDPELGMGIKFLGLKEEDRDHILNVLKKLAIL
ncbi:MAG: TIGR02266 family protein [Bradymonadales bacterium]|nr:MAG: TIGR02266 family protein [Bradymonadales bacterium]